MSSLSFSGNKTYYPSWYTGSFSPYMREMIDNVNCIGTESKLIDCSHNIKQRISYSTPKVECQHGEHELTSIKHFLHFHCAFIV